MERNPITAQAWNGSAPGAVSCARGRMQEVFVAAGTAAPCGCRLDATFTTMTVIQRSADNTEEIVTACKTRTFERWLHHLDTTLAGRNVLEVGFGGGSTLAWMRSQGARVAGVEPVEANRQSAIRSGVPDASVKTSLEDLEGNSFDLVVYQDLFEHETEPAIHLATLNRLIVPGARALLVLPIADCLSRRLTGSGGLTTSRITGCSTRPRD